MIIDEKKGDIFEAPCKHIAFAVNTEGINDSGFAGTVSWRWWKELAHIGPQKLGTVLSHKADGRTFHAIVCHSLKRGWARSPEAIEKALNSLDVPEDEEIAIVKIGSGPVGIMSGAPTSAILEAMNRSKKKLIVYTR